MTHLKIISLAILIPTLLCANVYFPLAKGDNWVYADNSYACEGEILVSLITGDTILQGKTYAVFNGSSVFGAHFARCDSLRVFVFDTISHSEYKVFDFSAQAGDTVSTRDSGSTVIIALGSLEFETYYAAGYNSTCVVRDSIGVIGVAHQSCYLGLESAYIDGRKAYPTIVTEQSNSAVPLQAFLAQNYPNPFNSSTMIRFSLPSAEYVSLDVFNNLGQEVAQLTKARLNEGWHQINWDAGMSPSGVYYFKLKTNAVTRIRSAILLK